ncbi:MAG: multicopper oxidase domain-containing protein [Acidobacteriia bacterium]|nr:multicopper oxidase domain-containing protein [Terriglobia bacterium]
MNRRGFIKAGLAAGAAGLLGPARLARAQTGDSLTRYLDHLPVPPVLRPGHGTNRVVMTEFRQQLHSQMPPTKLWGYNGIYPGPTIEVRAGQSVDFQWESNLPLNHLLQSAVDHELHGANMGAPEVRNVVHLHGARVLPHSDGFPEAWFTPGFKHTGPAFDGKLYTYTNGQPATSLWYHDHALGITRLNVLTGLAGFYLIRDDQEDSLNLPDGDYEIPLLIQDRLFNGDGSLLYPIVTDGTQEVWIPEFFGDTVLVNGKVWPHLDVEPRKYRFRMLNGSNARFYHMTLVESTKSGQLLGNKPAPVFNQIGTDGGLLPAPVKLTELLMAPAERFDIVIDFSDQDGKNFVLTNDGPAPFPGGGEVVPTEVMQFRVSKRLSGRDTSSVPKVLNPLQLLSRHDAVQTRDLELSELDRDSDGFPIVGLLDGLRWGDGVTETPKAGTTEVWNLVNTTGDAHPIHVHLVEFQVLERQPFSQDFWDAHRKIQYTGPPQAPASNERPARKDTVISYPGLVTKIIAKFDLPQGTHASPGQRFHYVWHCHILEHEDNEMMRPMDVIA